MYLSDAFPQLAPESCPLGGKFKGLLWSHILFLSCPLTLVPPRSLLQMVLGPLETDTVFGAAD